jgi:hypothetical protein
MFTAAAAVPEIDSQSPIAELSREEKLRLRRENAQAEKIAHVRETLDAARLRGPDALIEAMFDFPPSKRDLATPEDLAFWAENAPKTTKDWHALGFKPAPGQKPWRIVEFDIGSRSATAYFWRREQLVERKKRKIVAEKIAATPENIAAAVFAVNRAAKRRRDAASNAYEAQSHGFARLHSAEKKKLYQMKDRGIAWLASEGHLQAEKIHGSLVVWAGLEYRFHSQLKPRGIELARDADAVFRAEAKPAKSSHMRIIDAKSLLAMLENRTNRFELLASVEMKHKRPPAPRRQPQLDDEFEDYEDDEGDEE